MTDLADPLRHHGDVEVGDLLDLAVNVYDGERPRWLDDAQLPRAERLLLALRQPPQRRWHCAACGELVEGGFEQCWSCGAMMAP